MKKFILALCIISGYLLNAQDHGVIFWDDLKAKVDYKDPLKEMSSFELSTFGKLVRLKAKALKAGNVLSEAETKEKKDLENTLAKNNIDYEYLFANRSKIVEKRRQAFEGLNIELDNQNIELSGYLLPLNFNKGKSNEFLLVPWVGACIHTPPPPKNQIVYVKTEEWAAAPGLFDAVILMGKITIIEKAANLYLEDGSSIIQTGYSVNAATIQKL